MKYNNLVCDVELLKESSLKINEISKTGDEIVRTIQTQIESIANDHWTGEESRKYLAEYDAFQNSYNRLKSRLDWMEQTMKSFAIKVENFDNEYQAKFKQEAYTSVFGLVSGISTKVQQIVTNVEPPVAAVAAPLVFQTPLKNPDTENKKKNEIPKSDTGNLEGETSQKTPKSNRSGSNTPYVKQTGNKTLTRSGCYLSCYTMLFNKNGLNKTLMEVYSENNSIEVKSHDGICARYGFKYQKVDTHECADKSKDSLLQEMRSSIIDSFEKNPQGIMVTFHRDNNLSSHAMVVTGYDEKTIYFHDPAVGADISFDKTIIYTDNRSINHIIMRTIK